MKKIITSAVLVLLFFGILLAQGSDKIPGNPIGGIIVKGEKNPGGQMMISPDKNTGFLNSLFISAPDNNQEKQPLLKPSLFKQITKDSDLKGMKVYFKKDKKVYKYLGDESRIVSILTASTKANKPRGCVNCTTRTCNGTVYPCSCYNGFCFCVICPDIIRLEDLQ